MLVLRGAAELLGMVAVPGEDVGEEGGAGGREGRNQAGHREGEERLDGVAGREMRSAVGIGGREKSEHRDAANREDDDAVDTGHEDGPPARQTEAPARKSGGGPDDETDPADHAQNDKENQGIHEFRIIPNCSCASSVRP